MLAPDEATLARWVLWGLALAAVAYGLWQFLKQDPPGRDPVFSPSQR